MTIVSKEDFIREPGGFFKYQAKKYLIEKFLKEPRYTKSETSAATRILDLNCDGSFWLSFSLGFKLNSLYFLLSADGKKLVNDGYKQFLLDFPAQKEYILDKGLNLPIPPPTEAQKPKTIKEFLQLDLPI